MVDAVEVLGKRSLNRRSKKTGFFDVKWRLAGKGSVAVSSMKGSDVDSKRLTQLLVFSADKATLFQGTELISIEAWTARENPIGSWQWNYRDLSLGNRFRPLQTSRVSTKMR